MMSIKAEFRRRARQLFVIFTAAAAVSFCGCGDLVVMSRGLRTETDPGQTDGAYVMSTPADNPAAPSSTGAPSVSPSSTEAPTAPGSVPPPSESSSAAPLPDNPPASSPSSLAETPAPVQETGAVLPTSPAGSPMTAEGDASVSSSLPPTTPLLADSDGRTPFYEEYSYFLPELTDEERANLYAMYEGIASFQETILLPAPVSSEEVKDLFTLLRNECPELMQLDSSWKERSNLSGDIVSVQPSYCMDQKTWLEYRYAVETLFSDFHFWLERSSDYDIELAMFDYIITNCVYSTEAENCGNAYGALIDGAAKCDGRAAALVWALRSFGITSSVITGSDHAWVLAHIEGYDYNVDPTYDDNESNGEQLACTYAHFNIPESAIATDPYPADEMFVRRGYPATVRWDANYHVRSGLWVAAGQDAQSMFFSQLELAASAGSGTINLRFDSAEEFAAAKAASSDWIQSFLNQRGLGCRITTYGADDANILYIIIRFNN